METGGGSNLSHGLLVPSGSCKAGEMPCKWTALKGKVMKAGNVQLFFLMFTVEFCFDPCMSERHYISYCHL